MDYERPACLAVLIPHFKLWGDYRSHILTLIKSISPRNSGAILFFVLSSFLITSISIKQWKQDGTLYIGRFWARRAFRILPLPQSWPEHSQINKSPCGFMQSLLDCILCAAVAVETITVGVACEYYDYGLVAMGRCHMPAI
jgi:hypothetical protein